MQSATILLYTEDYGIGGVAQFNHSLLCKLARMGYDTICVQTRYYNSQIDQQKKLGIKHIWLEFDPMKEWLRVAYNQADATQIFQETKPDLIIFSDGWPLSNFSPKQVAINMGIPYIVILGYVDESYADFDIKDGIPYVDLCSYQYQQAAKVIAVSNENLGLLQKIFKLNPEQGKVIYYGRPASYFNSASNIIRQAKREELGISNDQIVCFTAARLTPKKGYLYQLEAIKKLKETAIWPQLCFIWAGSGKENYDNQEPELKEIVRNLGVSEQVKFLGQRADISDLLEASDIFILTSESEGMPLAIMEAMAKELPVIATAVSGIPEELGETGKLLPNPHFYPAETVRELTETVAAWAGDFQLRKAVGKAGRERAEKMFREERMLREYVGVIEQVLWEPQTLGNRVKSPEFFKWENQLYHNSLLWKAWESFERNNLTETFDYLQESLPYSILKPTETIISLIETFARIAVSKGVNFAVDKLTKSQEWSQLMELVITGYVPLLPGENRRKIAINYAPIQPQKSAYKLSICLPTYNGEKFLKAALDSVLNQDFRDFQVIIFDDDSRDNTAAIIKDYLARDNRIKYCQNSQRLGLFANWNKCLEYGNSEYVTIFAQDDIMFPNNLSAKIKILDENPRVGLVASSISQIDDHGQIINSKWAQYETDLLVNGEQWSRENVGKPNPICCPFVVMRKTALESVGNRFNTDYDFAGDYEMWLRIAREWDLYFMQETLGYYRQHNFSETGKQDEVHKVAEQIRVWSEWIDQLDVPRSQIIELENQAFTNIVEWFTYYLALPYIRKGKLDTAIELSYLIEQWRGRDAKLSILISQLGLEMQNLRGQLDQIRLK